LRLRAERFTTSRIGGSDRVTRVDNQISAGKIGMKVKNVRNLTRLAFCFCSIHAFSARLRIREKARRIPNEAVASYVDGVTSRVAPG